MLRKFVNIVGLLWAGVGLCGADIGLPVGASVPDFELIDQNGISRSTKSWLGPKGGVILFIRSADWCPYCKSQLVDFERNASEFEKLGLGIIGVSYDSRSVVQEFAARRGIRFPILSDPDSKVIKLFGVLNSGVPKEHPYYGSAYPCLFVLSEKSVIVSKYFEEDPQLTRVFPDILAQRLGVIPAVRQAQAESQQLTFVATASHSMVAAGQRISVVLDIQMKPNMHLYGPNVQGYFATTWAVNKSDVVTDSAISYPRAENVHLAAINDSVPVYRGRFRFRGVITLADDLALRNAVDKQGNFRVEGTLKYQACDNRICYVPQSVPMSWTLHYIGFDRGAESAKVQ